MGQKRLNDLVLLSIEAKIAKCIDFQDVINDFAVKKARKAFCWLNWHIGVLQKAIVNDNIV